MSDGWTDANTKRSVVRPWTLRTGQDEEERGWFVIAQHQSAPFGPGQRAPQTQTQTVTGRARVAPDGEICTVTVPTP